MAQPRHAFWLRARPHGRGGLPEDRDARGERGMTHRGSPPRRATRRRARMSVSAVVFLTTAFWGGMLAAVPPAVTAYAADTPVAASLALNEPLSSCNSNGFGGGTLNMIARADPQWVPVHQDASKPFPNDDPTILEGTVMTPAQKGNLQDDS